MAYIPTVLAVVSAVTSVVSLAMTLSMRPDGAKDTGTAIDRRGADNPKIVAFGNCIVPAVRVWNNVNNSNTRWLAQAYSLGVGELKSVDKIYIDGTPYNGLIEANQWYGIKSSRTFPNACLGVRLGRPTEEVYQQLIPHSDGEWTVDCRGDSTASISMLIERWVPEGNDNNIRIMSDSFKVEAMVQGNAVIDPRLDPYLNGAVQRSERVWLSGEYEVYRNPACILLTYLVDNYYGMAIPADAIDVESFIALANYCESRDIHFDGYVNQNQSFGDVLKDMVTSFDGIVYVEDGLVKVKADRITHPVAHVTEGECVGSFKLSNANDAQYFNIVNVEYTNSNTYHKLDKYVLPKDVTVVHQRDGFEKVKDIKLPYTVENGGSKFVKYIANKTLKQANYQKTIEFELDNTKVNLHVWDVFTLSNEAYKLDRVQFRVDKVVTSLDEKTTISKVTATQFEPTVYDDSSYEDGNSSNPVLPPNIDLLEPVNLTFNQTGFDVTGQGVLAWETRYMREHRTIIEYKLHSAPTWVRVGEFQAESYTFVGLLADAYDFRVATQTFQGSTSPWAVIENISISSNVAMPNVTNLTASFDSVDCLVRWDDMTTLPLGTSNLTYAEIFSHYEVQVYKGANKVYTSTYKTMDNHFVYTYSMNTQEQAQNRNLHFKVLMVSKEGTKSYVATSVSVANTQCAQPSGVAVTGTQTDVYIRWDTPTESDYAGTEIHISQDPTFTPSGLTLSGVSVGEAYAVPFSGKGTYYVRVGHFDVFDNLGIAYSVPISFTQKTIEDVLVESPEWEDMNQEINGVKSSITNLNGSVESLHGLIESTDGKVEAITQIKHDVDGKVSGLIMGNNGETSHFDVVADKFRVSSSAGTKPVFQVDSVSGLVTIPNTLIGQLEANNIKAGIITGNHIASNTKVIAGQGTSSATLDGQDATYRIYAGHSTPASAPFRVDKAGKLCASNADVKGVIRAQQLIFEPSATYPDEIKNSNVTPSSIGAETPSGAQAKANAALNAAKTDATNKANAAKASAEQYALAKANAAQVAAQAHADGIVTEAEAAAIAEAERLASVAEANAKKDAAAAKAAADKAQSAANAAQSTANTANSGVNTINGKMYPNQSKTQIKSSNYVAGSAGWAVDEDGFAEFSNATIRGTIYADKGKFSGDITGASGTFSGTVYAEKIIGDVMTSGSSYFEGTRIGNIGTYAIASFQIEPAHLDIGRSVAISGLNWQLNASAGGTSNVPSKGSAVGELQLWVDGVRKASYTSSVETVESFGARASADFSSPFVGAVIGKAGARVDIKMRYGGTSGSCTIPAQEVLITMMPHSTQIKPI
ncbi:phage tail tip fiber protein [Vibrio parahaemolyticus]